jgi:glyoxylase-like metal-dependent hydrolase (beta-lactamase superfamily II)
MKIKTEIINMPPKNTNSVLIAESGRLPPDAARQRKAVIFDPWGRAQDWLHLLNDRKLQLSAIYCTHGHFDHVSAVSELVSVTGAPWFLHPADIGIVEWSNQILFEIGATPINLEKMPPEVLAAGEIEILPGLFATAIGCPGHSAGGMAFHIPDKKTLIIGDTLFQDGIGRHDLPSANLEQLKKSVAKIRGIDLPDKTRVIHGHGPETTIRWLKKNNCFFH